VQSRSSSNGKWVKVGGWVDRDAAAKLILDAIARFVK
jgi:inorganic pyrophosphatase